MNRTTKDIFVGMIAFLTLALIIIWITSIGWIIPEQIISWLNESPKPQMALYSFGALTSGLILGLLRFGLVIPKLKTYIPDQALKYVAGLPLWLIGIFIILSSISLFLVYPTCRTPGSVVFEISGRESLRPSETLTVKAGESLTLKAKSIEQTAQLHCQWQYAGNAFQMLGKLEGCDIEIEFSPKPGEGFLTLVASYGFCSQSAVFSIPVKVPEQ